MNISRAANLFARGAGFKVSRVAPQKGSQIRALRSELKRLRASILIVDAGASDDESGKHVWSGINQLARVDLVGFDPQVQGLPRGYVHGKDTSTMLPLALGDGKEHTLYVYEDPRFTSLFELDQDFCRPFTT